MLIFNYNSDIFIERPGDGEDFVYSPVGDNATIYCAVNNTILFWNIDILFLPFMEEYSDVYNYYNIISI